MRSYKLGYILLFMLTLLASASGFTKGFKYTSKEGKISIKFPAEFKAETSFPEAGKTVKISSEFNKINFFVSYTLHTRSLDNREELANVGLASFNETLGGKIEEKSTWEYKKHKGVRASIFMAAQNVTLNYISILIGSIQYQIVVYSEKPIWDQKIADKFFKSFKRKE